MRESGYFPAGAEFDPSAPYNEPTVPGKEFDVTVSQSLSKSTIVYTNDYIPGASGVDYEPDDEGGYCAYGWHDPDDTSDTNWKKAYTDSSYTPLEIIEKCGEMCKYLLEIDQTKFGKYFLKRLLDECQGWTEDDFEVVED